MIVPNSAPSQVLLTLLVVISILVALAAWSYVQQRRHPTSRKCRRQQESEDDGMGDEGHHDHDYEGNADGGHGD